MLELVAITILGGLTGWLLAFILNKTKAKAKIEEFVKPKCTTNTTEKKIKVVEYKKIDGAGELQSLYYAIECGKYKQELNPIIKNYEQREDGITYEEACQFASDLRHNGGVIVNNADIHFYKGNGRLKYWLKVDGWLKEEPVLTFKEAHNLRLRRGGKTKSEIKKTY